MQQLWCRIRQRALGNNYLDSLAHTYICKSLIHKMFTQEEGLFCHKNVSEYQVLG